MKILVAGDVEGKFEQLFTRVDNIQKKSGQFDMLLCVGTFFSAGDDCKMQWQKLRNGELKAPLPTYVMGPTSKDHVSFYGTSSCDGEELCDNITFLGQAGVFTATNGLQLAYLSGRYSEQDYTASTENKSLREYFNQSDVDRLTTHAQKKDYVGVDIFLSTDWPSDVTIGTSPPVILLMLGSQLVVCLAVTLKPRYHFVTLQKVFYERTPYRNHRVLQEAPQHCTRFITLANVGKPNKKQRFLYAFNITPLSSMSSSELTAQPQSSTDCPYTKSVTSYHQSQVKLECSQLLMAYSLLTSVVGIVNRTTRHQLKSNHFQSDVDRLTAHAEKKDYVGVDMFLSTDWPSDVTI